MSNLPAIDFESIFSEAFDTFKAFNRLSVVIVTCMPHGTSKNIWQILNHLIFWQKNQLLLIQGKKPEKNISEIDTWIKTTIPNGQEEINTAVNIFDSQVNDIKTIVLALSPSEPNFDFKLKTLMDMATHLSFHLGEIISLRRQCGNYPMPENMTVFLETVK